MKWEKVKNKNNFISDKKEYCCSYNPKTDLKYITSFANFLSKNKKFKDGEETALYSKKTNEWRILEGDFRKDYEKCKSLEECIIFYENNPAKSNWSVVNK